MTTPDNPLRAATHHDPYPPRTTRRLLRAIRSYYANRQRDALLRDCDPRLLKDIGLRWERGKLVPINPERFASKDEAIAPFSPPGASESLGEVCPHCGARLAQPWPRSREAAGAFSPPVGSHHQWAIQFPQPERRE